MTHSITPDQSLSGDHCTRTEMLRFSRIRVERQEVLLGETDPMICCHADQVVIAGGNAMHVRSKDHGVTWTEPKALADFSPGSRLCALGTNSQDHLLAAVWHDEKLNIFTGLDCDTRATNPQAVEAAVDPGQVPGRFLITANNDLLLFLGSTVLCFDNLNARWNVRADMPTGWRDMRPVLMNDGAILCAVLIEKPQEKICHTFITRSSDGGSTWGDPRCATRHHETPGDLLAIDDQQLVLTYGQHSNPYGARAMISHDAGQTWNESLYILNTGRSNGPRMWPMPRKCRASAGVASTIGPDGTLLTAYDRGEAITTTKHPDPEGDQPAIGVVRWMPDGLKKNPLFYPNLWTHTLDREGLLDNGVVKMRPDDRFEGGDYIEPYEMMVAKRLPAEQFHFPSMGSKGAVVCRHPDGSLMTTSRMPILYRSTDEGRSWEQVQEVERSGENPDTTGFGITSQGTLLVSYCDRADRSGHVARSQDGGKSWQQLNLQYGPMPYVGGSDSCRIIERSNGVLMMVGATWLDEQRKTYKGDVILRSTDDGSSWGDATVLPPGFEESNIMELDPDTLLMATRYQRHAQSFDFFKSYTVLKHFLDVPYLTGHGTWEKPSHNEIGYGRYKNEAVVVSHDGGRNWTTPKLVTRMNEVSSDLARTHDGMIVLTYDQKQGVGGSRALVSKDNGVTWEEQIYALRWGHRGRTSSIGLKDGSILTLLADVEDGTRVTIWRPQ